MYVDSSRFTELAAPALEAWASSTFVSIDMSERSHNRMRNDLNTSGPGRSPTVSSNRVFCREVAAAHVAHGGDCIGSGKGMSLNPAAASAQGLKLQSVYARAFLFKYERWSRCNRSLHNLSQQRAQPPIYPLEKSYKRIPKTTSALLFWMKILPRSAIAGVFPDILLCSSRSTPTSLVSSPRA